MMGMDRLISEGISLARSGAFPQALACFDRALELEPNNTVALSCKGSTLANLQQPNQALEYYEKALVIEPNNVGIN